MKVKRKVVTVMSKLQELGYNPDESNWDELKHLAKLTAMRRALDGTYYLGNWWRGPLLYALVSHYKPRNILEFGTGRGYGAVSMAKASLDRGFKCTVWTIDYVSPTARHPWPIDESDRPTVKFLSLQEVLAHYLPVEIRERIRCLTGDSYSVMREWRNREFPSIDFFFVDGGHDYWTVKHDFIAGLKVANPGAVFVFDDYGTRKGYGVKRLIDKEILPKCPFGSIEIIDTLAEQTRPASDARVEHKMVLFDASQISNLHLHFYSSVQVKFHIAAYHIISIAKDFTSRLKFHKRRLCRGAAPTEG